MLSSLSSLSLSLFTLRKPPWILFTNNPLKKKKKKKTSLTWKRYKKKAQKNTLIAFFTIHHAQSQKRSKTRTIESNGCVLICLSVSQRSVRSIWQRRRLLRLSSLTLCLSHIPNPDTHTRRQGDIGSSNIGSTIELVVSKPSIIYRINQNSKRYNFSLSISLFLPGYFLHFLHCLKFFEIYSWNNALWPF